MNPFKAAVASYCSMIGGTSGPGAGRRCATEYTQDMKVLAQENADSQAMNTDTVHFSRVDGQIRVWCCRHTLKPASLCMLRQTAIKLEMSYNQPRLKSLGGPHPTQNASVSRARKVEGMDLQLHSR